METSTPTAQKNSKIMLWIGCVISAVPVLLMGGMPTVMLFTGMRKVLEGMAKYGYPASAAKPILITEICCAVLYAIPRTAVLGAILLTGYLGGAVATHVRVGEPFVMPVVIGVIVWLGLYLRDARVRALVPWRG